jgi:hypothetical protein
MSITGLTESGKAGMESTANANQTLIRTDLQRKSDMTKRIIPAPDASNSAALLMTLANIEQAAKHAAQTLLIAEDQPSAFNALEALLVGIQRKADALRVLRYGVTA